MGTNYYAKRDLSSDLIGKLQEALNSKDIFAMKNLLNTYSENRYSPEAFYMFDVLPIEFHLGKSSVGWKFLWQVTLIGDDMLPVLPFDKIGIKDWFMAHSEYKIFDEYGREVSLYDFLNIAFDDDGYTLDSYHEVDRGYQDTYFVNLDHREFIGKLGFTPSKHSDSEFINDGLRFCLNDFS